MKFHARRGSSLIEFILAAAFLAPVLVGAAQYLEAYRCVATLERATLRAAQMAAALPYDAVGEAPSPEFRRTVVETVMTEAAAAGQTPPGFTREHVHVAMRFALDRPSEVQVWIVGYRVALPVDAPLDMNGTPRATAPFIGHWTKTAAP
ncbi:MAG: hypothetical protein FJW31_17345 [Acidobacteria bacterium]|nr:hypothetical protein [Acidobacteriota bacterium]